MIMLDSDIIIWILRGKKSYRKQFDQATIQVRGKIYITPIQIAEIYAGIRDNERENTNTFFQSLHLLCLDEIVGKKAGELMKLYKKSHNVTIADSFIAASALIYNYKLWTLNKKHYPMISENDFWNE